jgi:two-component system cell cycle sensor histidine kinase/response regulator CckA
MSLSKGGILAFEEMDLELERSVRERTRQLEDINESLRRREQIYRTELETLQQIATQLITTYGTEALYEQVLDTALAILHADLASIQMVHPEQGTNGELKLLGHRGFSPQAAKRWEWVGPNSRTTCGEALRTGRRVTVPDVRQCDFMAGSEDLEAMLDAGIHAAQTAPLVSRSGALLGMVTTYWREPHELSVTELHGLDILARLAADVIERSLAEEQLRESEERFRSVADSAPVIIFQNDAAGKITFFNKQATTFTGRTLEQLVGYGWLEAVHPDDLERIMASHRASLQAPITGQRELRLRRSDGEFRWMLVTATPRAVGGHFAGYTGTIVDITDLKRAHGELLAAQKFESLGVLASGIAHDFNNLLGGILAEAELAATELPAGGSALDSIQRIGTVASRGAEIVRELMIYSGQENADPVATVDLSSLVEEMLELLKISISKHVILKTDLHHNLPGVLGRASQIRQIVMNLVLNASEAIGEEGGVVTVATSRTTLAPNETPNGLPHLAPGDYLKFEVSDTGKGMTAEVQARVFDPFFSTKFPGRGLGLAVVQGIVRDHGGKIDLISVPDRGTTFEILLPSAGEIAQSSRDVVAHVPEKTHRSRSGTILVVEDEETLRFAVSKLLRKNGFVVIEATDGTSALELLRGHKIDLVLLDLTLPGASSREVLEEAQHTQPNVKVILTSAYSRETVDAAFAGVRTEHFIRKPFPLADLMASVREVLL